MKNLLFCFVLWMACDNICFAQYPVVQNAWVPYVVNKIEHVQHSYTIPQTYTITVPVTVPVIQYYQVPIAYYPPVYQPVVMVQKPCLFCPGRFYYINSLYKY